MDPFSPVIRIGAVNPARVAPEEETHAVCSAHLDRKSTRLNSSHGYISYAVFCLKKKKIKIKNHELHQYRSHPPSRYPHALTPHDTPLHLLRGPSRALRHPPHHHSDHGKHHRGAS